jgi:putative copper export protein/methionine-rich copper-binding protein CopC
MMQPSAFCRSLARWSLATIGAATLALGMAGTAEAADNTLVSSIPAAGSVEQSSPTTLSLTFANSLGAVNVVSATCNDGTLIPLGSPTVTTDKLSLSVPVTTPLPKGECVVAWQVGNPDGTPGGSGSFTFTIANDTAATTPPAETIAGGATNDGATTQTPAATTTPTTADGGDESSSEGPLGLARLISMIGIAVLFGSLVVIAVAWPEGVEYILTVRFLRTTWIVAAAGSYFYAAALAGQISGDGIGAGLIPTSWTDLTDNNVGLAALARIVFLLGAGWVIARPERAIDPSTQLPAMVLPGLAVATLAFSRDGGDLAALGAIAGIAHALAISVWFGGLVLLARVVLAGPGDEDLVHAVRGFSKLSTPAIIVTVLSGFVQTFRLDRGTLFSTGHGRVLLLKTVAVAGMVFVGLLARQFIRARLARADTMTAPLAIRLRRALSIEALAGVMVMVLTAWLLSLAPGNTVATAPDVNRLGPSVNIVDSGLGVQIRVKVTITGVVGTNAVRVDVFEPESGLASLFVDFTPPDPAVSAVTLTVPLTGAGSALLSLQDGLPLAAAGTWTITVRVADVPVGSKTITVSPT